MYHKLIRTEDYRYILPEERIATYPEEDRDQSKLLVFRNNSIHETRFFNLPDLLPPDSTIIWNNTKVIPARLQFNKATGALIEIFLLEPALPSSYITVFSQRKSCEWKVIVGNQKKWKGEHLTRAAVFEDRNVELTVEYVDNNNKSQVLLSWTPEDLTFAQILDIFGKTPIPPYLKRESVEGDKVRYQTVYADFDGSVAAPTAGLHFTSDLIELLKQQNISFDSVTLHVGSGTFIPVKSSTIGEHIMHAETVIINKATIQNLLVLTPDKLTVVGTTSLRSLESLFWLGNKLNDNPNIDSNCLTVDQWVPYNTDQPISSKEALGSVLNYMNDWNLDHLEFVTRLLIVPGYKFKLVHRLITNFHQPSSTLLLLVSALVGEKWREIYDYALKNDFRFLSYGDSSILEIPS